MTNLALIATRKGLFKLNDDFELEEVAFMGDPVSMVLAGETLTKESVWYAALQLGHFGVKLHKSNDQGSSWQEVTTPFYPSSEEPDKGDSLELIWSLAFADPANPEKLWAGTVPGGLFYSNDGAQSWQLNQPLWQFKQQQEWFGGGYDHAGIHSICVDPRNHNEIKVAVSCAGVWVTKDGGESWENQAKGMRAEFMPPEKQYDPTIQDPHRMVQCHSSPDHLWVQHHNGIFHSKDNSQSWQEITAVSPSSFGFATVVHPDDPAIAWFVPGVKDECRIPVNAQLIVNRTIDGGKTFQSLKEGLPAKASYDLIYRHGLAIDSTGNQLLMGTTTGNLWLSLNQGDNWQLISNYLPPIYAVYFLK